MSVSNISQATADLWFNVANQAVIIGSFVAVIGTLGAYWTSKIREDYANERERYSNERISKNESETATAKATAAVANESAAKANERAELLRQSNLEVQRQLEKERIERLRLEASIAPRRLSDGQRSVLISALRAAPQKLQIDFEVIGDQEATAFGESILSALNEAGVQGSANRIGMNAIPVYGVVLTLSEGNQKSLSIRTAFEKAKIPAVVTFSNVGRFDAKILVGLRPLGSPQ
jgi:hypothetical protein